MVTFSFFPKSWSNTPLYEHIVSPVYLKTGMVIHVSSKICKIPCNNHNYHKVLNNVSIKFHFSWAIWSRDQVPVINPLLKLVLPSRFCMKAKKMPYVCPILEHLIRYRNNCPPAPLSSTPMIYRCNFFRQNRDFFQNSNLFFTSDLHSRIAMSNNFAQCLRTLPNYVKKKYFLPSTW